MRKTIILSGLIAVLCAILLAGCTDSKSVFVGTWTLVSGKTNAASITFYSDGSCVVDEDETGEWSVVDGTLKVLGPYGGQFWSHDTIIGRYSIQQGRPLRITMTDARIDGDYTDTLIYEKVNDIP